MSESALQLVRYQYDMPLVGDEWVTSEVKWITVAKCWYIVLYGATGDELQSCMKILFFYLKISCAKL